MVIYQVLYKYLDNGIDGNILDKEEKFYIWNMYLLLQEYNVFIFKVDVVNLINLILGSWMVLLNY